MGQIIQFLLLLVILLNFPIGANSDCSSDNDLGRWEKTVQTSPECAASFFPAEVWTDTVDMYLIRMLKEVPDPWNQPIYVPQKLIFESRSAAIDKIAANIRDGYTRRIYTMALDAVRVMNESNLANLATIAKFPWAFKEGTGVHTTFEEYTWHIIQRITDKCGSQGGAY